MRQLYRVFFAAGAYLGLPVSAATLHPWEAVRTAGFPQPHPRCIHVTHELYGNSTHPGGGGSLEERNQGWGGTCHLKPASATWHLGLGAAGLTNSQGRVAGMIKVETGWRPLQVGWPQIGYLVPEIGVMGGVLSYERKNSRSTVLSPLVAPYYQVSWQYQSLSLGLREIILPEDVRLRHFQFSLNWELP